MRIGIICDVGSHAVPHAAPLPRWPRPARYFDHWSFSDEVGTFKPDPAIFRHAHAGLWASMTGSRRPTSATSVEPTSPVPRRSASLAVRYSGVFDDPGSATDGTDRIEGDHVLSDHAQSAAALGLG